MKKNIVFLTVSLVTVTPLFSSELPPFTPLTQKEIDALLAQMLEAPMPEAQSADAAPAYDYDDDFLYPECPPQQAQTTTEPSAQNPQKKHQCLTCNKIFSKPSNLTRHMKSHTGEKPYKCDYLNCTQSFLDPSGLARHEITHTGKRPYKCDYPNCTRSYSDPSNLTRHMQSHTGEKPCKCDYPNCTHSSAYPSNLATHEITHTGEKPYKCNYPNCTYSSAYPSNLATHEMIHTGEKPYKCDYQNCTYSSAYPSNLATHKRTHTGEKPYKCDYPDCTHSYSDRSSLARHKITHTGKKPFQCKFCKKSFIRKDTCRQHKERCKKKPAKELSNSTAPLPPSTYPCRFEGCEAVLTTEEDLKTHEQECLYSWLGV